MNSTKSPLDLPGTLIRASPSEQDDGKISATGGKLKQAFEYW